ncbi:MAG: hypothetical protein WCE50_20170 [Candidatus Acidiferrum sp.]
MDLRTSGAHDVFNQNPAYSQCITDKRTVATPWNRFRTHNRAPLLPGQFDQSVYPRFKFRGLHIIGEAAKGGIAPAHVGRIASCMAQAPELSQMNVADPRGTQLLRQGRAVELRVVSRAGNAPDIDHALDVVRPQKLQEVFPGAVRMPNGQDNGHF